MSMTLSLNRNKILKLCLVGSLALLIVNIVLVMLTLFRLLSPMVAAPGNTNPQLETLSQAIEMISSQTLEN